MTPKKVWSVPEMAQRLEKSTYFIIKTLLYAKNDQRVTYEVIGGVLRARFTPSDRPVEPLVPGNAVFTMRGAPGVIKHQAINTLNVQTAIRSWVERHTTEEETHDRH